MTQKIAIVTPRPQTTRTRQRGIITTNNYQMIFIDTPGIMKKPRHRLDKFMLAEAQNTLSEVDVILWLVDAKDRVGSGDQNIGRRLASSSQATPVILVINKSDQVPPKSVLAITDAYRALLPQARWMFISALKLQGTTELLQTIAGLLPLGPRYYPPDQITDAYVRDIAAELIREQVLLQVRDEIPHGVAVQVTEFKERKGGGTFIAATIFVERDTHKRIVIGKKGVLLREIGSKARRQIELLIGGHAYLELWVKVAPKWRERALDLKRFGYAG